ncbi:18377_t:CDS:2 [Rhizophagus irregularis]|nr:18377_t:CDS:2 [Rhizophagus irregularis]
MLIQRCLSIEYLNFAGVMAFHNDALIVAIIRTSPNLRHLEIGYNDIGDEVTETLAHTCHKLEHLELSGCSFTGKDIFPVVIDNNSTVENLGVEIRKVRQDLSQKNFNLYVRKFKQPNHGLVNTVNTTEKKQGELMEPPNKFTYYFSVEDIKGLKKNPPYLQYDGEIGPIHVIVYLQEVLEKDPEDTGL